MNTPDAMPIVRLHNGKRLLLRKTYKDVPFAHRQHLHKGHCRHIHGHNWSFEFTFYANTLDECGFIVDFGKLKEFKAAVLDPFDHALVLSENDALAIGCVGALNASSPHYHELFKLLVVPDCSCEGLAGYMLDRGNAEILRQTNGRVGVLQVVVFEDERNSCVATTPTSEVP